MADTKTEINLAVYMERLDAYIESQTALNNNLCASIESVNRQLSDINIWRGKMYGAKTFAIGLGVLILHTSVVMGSFLALINFMDN